MPPGRTLKKSAEAELDKRSEAVTMKVSNHWKRWLERASKHFRMTISAFIDASTLEYAKNHGFTDPPPDR